MKVKITDISDRDSWSEFKYELVGVIGETKGLSRHIDKELLGWSSGTIYPIEPLVVDDEDLTMLVFYAVKVEEIKDEE
jgi:hypothetical protein